MAHLGRDLVEHAAGDAADAGVEQLRAEAGEAQRVAELGGQERGDRADAPAMADVEPGDAAEVAGDEAAGIERQRRRKSLQQLLADQAGDRPHRDLRELVVGRQRAAKRRAEDLADRSRRRR